MFQLCIFDVIFIDLMVKMKIDKENIQRSFNFFLISTFVDLFSQFHGFTLNDFSLKCYIEI